MGEPEPLNLCVGIPKIHLGAGYDGIVFLAFDGQQFVDRARMYTGVSIQKENVFDSTIQRPLHPLIASLCKSKVFRVLNEVRLREAFADFIGGSVCRAVID
jgi:hypothetical protein